MNQDMHNKPQNFKFIFGTIWFDLKQVIRFQLIFGTIWFDLKQVIRFHYWNYMDNGGTKIPMHVWQLHFTKTVWNRDFHSRDEIGEVSCGIYIMYL